MKKILKGLAGITWIGGGIGGLVAAIVTGDGLPLALILWGSVFISGCILYALGEILENQESILQSLTSIAGYLNQRDRQDQ